MKHFSRRSFFEKFGIGATATIVLPLITPAKASPKMYQAKKLNVALCGLGNYAGMLANGLAASQYCQLSGIVTGHPEKAQLWQKQYNIPTKNIYNYQNFGDMANNKNIDLVYVVLPNAMHAEFAIKAAKAGKHVITEKPMATSAKDCEAMIKACKDAGVQLAVGYRLHYEPYHLELKRLGQQKVFGQIRFIEASLGYKTYDVGKPDTDFNINDASEWRLRKAMSGGGPLMDLGIYCLQSSRYVLGEEPTSVTAQFGPVNNKTRFAEVEETILWQLKFPSGAIANCTSSYAFNIDRLYAAADNGAFELSPALSYGPFKGKTSTGELNFPTINQQTAQLDGVGQLILENRPLPNHITGEEGLKDIKIIEAIYEAAKTGKIVSLI